MTQEDKNLLLQDLCARLPYGVMCKIQTRFVFEDGTLRRGSYDKILDLDTVTEIESWYAANELEKLKPYLRSLSSMTEDEIKELYKIEPSAVVYGASETKTIRIVDDINQLGIEMDKMNNVIDFLNSHHFDYRGLIERGLALEAPKGMYNN